MFALSRLLGRSWVARFSSAALLAATFAFAGCYKEAGKPNPQEADALRPEAGHAEEGPHQGSLIELGKEEYHAELVHDDAAHKVTIYLLDGAAQKPVGSADKELVVNLVVAGKPQQFKLPAAPQDGDAAGQASRFEVVDEAFCEALDAEKTTGRVNVTIAGKTFSGDVAHSGHDHDHGHKH